MSETPTKRPKSPHGLSNAAPETPQTRGNVKSEAESKQNPDLTHLKVPSAESSETDFAEAQTPELLSMNNSGNVKPEPDSKLRADNVSKRDVVTHQIASWIE